MQPAMAADQDDRGHHPLVVGGDGLAARGAAARKKPPSPTTMMSAPEPLLPAQAVAEPDGQDQQQEEQLGGEDGLDDAELAEAQGGGLQPELHQHEGEADEPDPPLDGVGHQAQPQGGRLGGRLDADPLEDRGQGVDEGGSGCQQVGHAPVVLANHPGARTPAGAPGRVGRTRRPRARPGRPPGRARPPGARPTRPGSRRPGRWPVGSRGRAGSRPPATRRIPPSTPPPPVGRSR